MHLIVTHKVWKIFRHRSLRAHEQKIFYDTLPLMFRAEQSNYVCSVLSSTEAEQMQNRRVTVWSIVNDKKSVWFRILVRKMFFNSMDYKFITLTQNNIASWTIHHAL